MTSKASRGHEPNFDTGEMDTKSPRPRTIVAGEGGRQLHQQHAWTRQDIATRMDTLLQTQECEDVYMFLFMTQDKDEVQNEDMETPLLQQREREGDIPNPPVKAMDHSGKGSRRAPELILPQPTFLPPTTSPVFTLPMMTLPSSTSLHLSPSSSFSMQNIGDTLHSIGDTRKIKQASTWGHLATQSPLMLVTRGDIMETISELTGNESADGVAGQFGKIPSTHVVCTSDLCGIDAVSLSDNTPDVEGTISIRQQDLQGDSNKSTASAGSAAQDLFQEGRILWTRFRGHAPNIRDTRHTLVQMSKVELVGRKEVQLSLRLGRPKVRFKL